MIKTFALGIVTVFLAACQSATLYNGQGGYEVLTQSPDNATIMYTLAGNPSRDSAKLEAACKQVLGTQQTFNVQILSINEAVNQHREDNLTRSLSNGRTNIGFSNTFDLRSNENAATLAVMDTHPTSSRVIRYRCK